MRKFMLTNNSKSTRPLKEIPNTTFMDFVCTGIPLADNINLSDAIYLSDSYDLSFSSDRYECEIAIEKCTDFNVQNIFPKNPANLTLPIPMAESKSLAIPIVDPIPKSVPPTIEDDLMLMENINQVHYIILLF